MNFRHKAVSLNFVQTPQAGDVVVVVSVKFPVEDCFLGARALSPEKFTNSEKSRRPPSAILALALQKELNGKLSGGQNFIGTKVLSTKIGSDGVWLNFSWTIKPTFSAVGRSLRDAVSFLRPSSPGVVAAYRQLEIAFGQKNYDAASMNWCIDEFNKGLDDIRCVVVGKLRLPSVKGKPGVVDKDKVKKMVEAIESKVAVKARVGKSEKPAAREYVGELPVVLARGKDAFLIHHFLNAGRILSLICRGKVIVLVKEKDWGRHLDRLKKLIPGYLDKLERKKNWNIGLTLAVVGAASAKVNASDVGTLANLNKAAVKSVLSGLK
jgi:hypothetical protein